MKKILTAALFAIVFAGCQKEETTPTPVTPTPPPVNEACKCGIIESANYSFSSGKWLFWVQNNCTGNYDMFEYGFPKEEGTIFCTDKTW
jgi:nitrous oxide reductase accessory protein NosL